MGIRQSLGKYGAFDRFFEKIEPCKYGDGIYNIGVASLISLAGIRNRVWENNSCIRFDSGVCVKRQSYHTYVDA